MSSVFIKETDFRSLSFLHGMGHTLRVSIFAARIGEETNHLCEGALASFASLFHDMARNSDCEAPNHGSDAVRTVLPRFIDKLSSFGLTKRDILEISSAMEWHSLPQEPPKNHPSLITIRILKDADALDRIRFKGLDPSFLRFSSSVGLIPDILYFYKATLDSVGLRHKDTPLVGAACELVKQWLLNESEHLHLIDELKDLPPETVSVMTRSLENPAIYDLVNRTIDR